MNEWLNVIDLSIALIILLFTVGGYQKGFASQIAFLVTSAFAAITLFFAYPLLYNWLGDLYHRMEHVQVMWILLFVLFLLAVLLFAGINKLLAKLAESQLSSSFDQIVGGLFGFIKITLFAGVILTLAAMISPHTLAPPMSQNSKVGKWICYKVVPKVQPRFDNSSIAEHARNVRGKMRSRAEKRDISFDAN